MLIDIWSPVPLAVHLFRRNMKGIGSNYGKEFGARAPNSDVHIGAYPKAMVYISAQPFRPNVAKAHALTAKSGPR
jgi:hypothetical protein